MKDENKTKKELIIELKKLREKITQLGSLTGKDKIGQLYHDCELILKSVGEGIYGLDMNGNTVFVNEPAAKMVGWKPKELIGKSQHRLIHHTKPDGTRIHEKDCSIYAAFKDGKEHRVDDELFWRKDGSSFPVEYLSAPIFGEKEQLLGSVVTFMDITERRQAEAMLRESENRFTSIFNFAKDSIFILDWENDIIVEANPKASELLGYSKEQLKKTPISKIHPNDLTNMSKIWKEIQTTGTTSSEDLSCTTKDNKVIPADISFSMITLSGSKYLVSYVRDISERKRAEKALKGAMEEVKELKIRLEAENVYLQEEIKLQHGFENIITGYKGLRGVMKKVEQVAPTDSTVLLTGETGTGKELFARALHEISDRADRPLVKVNCAALPTTLIESELFGHEKGAFTGAISRRVGRFELADGGTVFLDEIGALPLKLQAKLLRVLQEKEFERLGGTGTIKVDVRIIAATNRDLEKAIGMGEFRDDLYYRLNVFPINIPPLRERKEDIPLLVQHFVQKYAARLNTKIDTLPKSLINTLKDYGWPGNVRELENIIERSMITSTGPILELGEWEPKEVLTKRDSQISTLREIKTEHIFTTLKMTGWKVSGEKGAAKILGLKSPTLVSKMKTLGITRPT